LNSKYRPIYVNADIDCKQHAINQWKQCVTSKIYSFSRIITCAVSLKTILWTQHHLFTSLFWDLNTQHWLYLRYFLVANRKRK
jgi:hypothetical protein